MPWIQWPVGAIVCVFWRNRRFRRGCRADIRIRQKLRRPSLQTTTSAPMHSSDVTSPATCHDTDWVSAWRSNLRNCKQWGFFSLRETSSRWFLLIGLGAQSVCLHFERIFQRFEFAFKMLDLLEVAIHRRRPFAIPIGLCHRLCCPRDIHLQLRHQRLPKSKK